jgi:hypothetical protein
MDFAEHSAAPANTEQRKRSEEKESENACNLRKENGIIALPLNAVTQTATQIQNESAAL